MRDKTFLYFVYPCLHPPPRDAFVPRTPFLLSANGFPLTDENWQNHAAPAARRGRATLLKHPLQAIVYTKYDDRVFNCSQHSSRISIDSHFSGNKWGNLSWTGSSTGEVSIACHLEAGGKFLDFRVPFAAVSWTRWFPKPRLLAHRNPASSWPSYWNVGLVDLLNLSEVKMNKYK